MGPSGLRRVIDAVQLVGLSEKGLSVAELASALDLPRSTAHRFVASLAAVGLLQRGEESGRYVLGALVPELAGDPGTWRRMIEACRPYMDALRDETGESVALHILHAERRVLLYQAESHHEHRWVYRNLRVPMPLHAGAAAKMLLALMPPEDVRRLILRDRHVAFTRKTPRDAAALAREIARIRLRRYALSAGEVSPAIASIAVPVVDGAGLGLPQAILCLTGPSVRLTDRALMNYLPKLRLAAKRSLDRLAGEAKRGAEAA